MMLFGHIKKNTIKLLVGKGSCSGISISWGVKVSGREDKREFINKKRGMGHKVFIEERGRVRSGSSRRQGRRKGRQRKDIKDGANKCCEKSIGRVK